MTILSKTIARQLVLQYPEACQLLSVLMSAIDLERKQVACHEEIAQVDLANLHQWTTPTLDNLSMSDATPVESDHVFRVLSEFADALKGAGLSFQSADDEAQIYSSLRRSGSGQRVTWALDTDADTPFHAAKYARDMMLDDESQANVFEVLDRDGEKVTVDLTRDRADAPIGIEQALADMMDDVDLGLWEARVGLIRSGLPNKGQVGKIHCLYVAAHDEQDARDEAVALAIENIYAGSALEPDSGLEFATVEAPQRLNTKNFICQVYGVDTSGDTPQSVMPSPLADFSYPHSNELCAIKHIVKTRSQDCNSRIWQYDDREAYAKALWEDFGNVPVSPENETIEDDWMMFAAGTDRYEIWHWFETEFGLSVASDLMGMA